MEVKWDTNFLKTRSAAETRASLTLDNHKTGPHPSSQKRIFEKVEQESESKKQDEARAARIGSTRGNTMLAARFCTSPALGSRRRFRARPPARLSRSLANNLTLTIVIVTLFASFAIAASFSSWQPEYSRRQLLSRLSGRLAELQDRALANDLHEQAAQDEIEADDEQFLRHLKQAAEYLDARLANEPHEQQPVSVEFEDNGAGPLPASRYEMLDSRDNNLNERYQYALPVDSAPLEASLPAGQQSGDLLQTTADDNQLESEPKTNLMNYLLMLDRARELDRSGPQRDEANPAKTIVSPDDLGDHLEASKRQKPRETTLLEDEQDDEQQSRASPTAAKTKPASSTGAYGTVAHTSQEQPANSQRQQDSPAGMFERFKANLSYYMPFLSQINILQRAGSEKVGSPHTANETKHQQQQQQGGSLAKDSDGLEKTDDIDKQQDDKNSRLQPAKQGVSATKAIEVDQDEPAAAKHLQPRVNVSRPSDDQTDAEDQADERKLGGNVRLSSTSKRLSVAMADNDRELDDMVAAQELQEQQQQGPRTISAMRQSSLLMPLREELLVRGAPDGGASGERDSLLGRYIYAPTQHYYLNTIPTRPHVSSSQQQEQLKPAYAFQKEPGSLLSFAHFIDPSGAAANKSGQSNDLYFLVMVGAFCVMAMAVVLAAGLFAYRVQQQRKASQDTDYPTYGVVGPNNMAGAGAGKSAGAAAFVNGYFNSPLASGKSASAKHLPDLYGQAAAIDSGLEKSLSASISSSHKKSSASTISSARASNNEAPTRATNGNNLFASTAANQDAARMYHYQHQKQQMIVSDRSSAGRHTSASDLDSDEGDDDGSYTVYECPGLASAHEMEIKNPLFNDDHSP